MSGSGDGRLILIVEDNERNMKLARDVLQFHGFRTVETVSGEEGVIMARDTHPDLILMDISLPGIDGVEATRRLKGDPSTADIPIVALTASVLHSDRARFEDAAFVGLIAKPIDVLTFPEQVLAYCPERKDES
jgi:two-component system cell cycle response regulator DivK